MTAALIGLVIVLAAMFVGVPIGVAMALVGLIGFSLYTGFAPALSMASQTFHSTGMDYALSILPLFILMGNLVNHSGLSQALYRASYTFIGHRRGGLAMATIFASGGLSAVSGSSLATAATMAKVAVPSMRAYGYADKLASASVAAGGTLGILLPPSIVMVLYGILTETDIGALFIAGIIPGLLGIAGYIVAIVYMTAREPGLGPPAERFTWAERLASLKSVVLIVILFTVVIGGIYTGAFTSTEAAGIGAAGAFLIALGSRRLTFKSLMGLLGETARTTAMIFIIIIGALMFASFINITGFPSELQSFITGLGLPPWGVLLAILLVYLVLGCVMESMSMILLTVPLFFPLMSGLGYHPVWFGIVVVVATEISFITPPVGMNLFVVRSVVPDLKASVIMRGIMPFVAVDTVRLFLIAAVPAISLWLPSMMSRF